MPVLKTKANGKAIDEGKQQGQGPTNKESSACLCVCWARQDRIRHFGDPTSFALSGGRLVNLLAYQMLNLISITKYVYIF